MCAVQIIIVITFEIPFRILGIIVLFINLNFPRHVFHKRKMMRTKKKKKKKWKNIVQVAARFFRSCYFGDFFFDIIDTRRSTNICAYLGFPKEKCSSSMNTIHEFGKQ